MDSPKYQTTLVEVDDMFYAVPDSFKIEQTDMTPVMPVDEDGDPVIPDDWIEMDWEQEDSYRMLAVRLMLDDWDSRMEVFREEVSIGRNSWMVYTDSEADDAWDRELGEYIDSALEIPEHVRSYFDEERWKSDARNDGRGHALAHYDGEEREVETAWGTFFIFRQN